MGGKYINTLVMEVHFCYTSFIHEIIFNVFFISSLSVPIILRFSNLQLIRCLQFKNGVMFNQPREII